MTTEEALKALADRVDYAPGAGLFFWRGTPIEVHQTITRGYCTICYAGCHVRAHRLAFFMMTGVLPSELDHANRVKTDNRWSNLRVATPAQNTTNRMLPNKYGFPGVSRKKNKYRAAIIVEGQRKHLGYFKTPAEAGAAYVRASREFNGEFSPFVEGEEPGGAGVLARGYTNDHGQHPGS